MPQLSRPVCPHPHALFSRSLSHTHTPALALSALTTVRKVKRNCSTRYVSCSTASSLAPVPQFSNCSRHHSTLGLWVCDFHCVSCLPTHAEERKKIGQGYKGFAKCLARNSSVDDTAWLVPFTPAPYPSYRLLSLYPHRCRPTPNTVTTHTPPNPVTVTSRNYMPAELDCRLVQDRGKAPLLSPLCGFCHA
jgi:hypothetical protein